MRSVLGITFTVISIGLQFDRDETEGGHRQIALAEMVEKSFFSRLYDIGDTDCDLRRFIPQLRAVTLGHSKGEN